MVEKILEEREDGTQEAGRGESSCNLYTKFDFPSGVKASDFTGVRSIGEHNFIVRRKFDSLFSGPLSR